MALVVALGAGSACQARDGHEPPVVGRAVVGQPAPDFSRRTLDGHRLSLHDLRGKVVLVNFWGSWCVACRREFPALAAFRARHADAVVVGVVYQDASSDARTFARRHHATWPSVVDPGGEIAAAWKAAPGAPETWAVDRDGVVRGRRIGESVAADLENLYRRASG